MSLASRLLSPSCSKSRSASSAFVSVIGDSYWRSDAPNRSTDDAQQPRHGRVDFGVRQSTFSILHKHQNRKAFLARRNSGAAVDVEQPDGVDVRRPAPRPARRRPPAPGPPRRRPRRGRGARPAAARPARLPAAGPRVSGARSSSNSTGARGSSNALTSRGCSSPSQPISPAVDGTRARAARMQRRVLAARRCAADAAPPAPRGRP